MCVVLRRAFVVDWCFKVSLGGEKAEFDTYNLPVHFRG